MAFIANVRFEFIPPGGDAPIVVLGGQDYSPGQRRKSDRWVMLVPEVYRGSLSDKDEADSYGATLKILAACFCAGDEAEAESRLVSKEMSDAART